MANPFEKYLTPTQNDQESIDTSVATGPNGEPLNLPPNTGASNEYGAIPSPVTNSSANPFAKYVSNTPAEKTIEEPSKEADQENPFAKYVKPSSTPEQSTPTIALPQATPQQLADAGAQGYSSPAQNQISTQINDFSTPLSQRQPEKRPVEFLEAAGRGLVGGLAKANELMAQGVGVFPYMEDKTLQAFGVDSDIYNRYMKAVHSTGLGQPGVEAEEIKPSEYLTTGGKIGQGLGEMAAPLPYMIASGGVGAEEQAAQEAFQVVKPLMTPIRQGIQSMLPMATQAGAETVQRSAQQGDNPVTQAAKGIASATATAVTGAIPLSMRSKIVNPLARFLEQGAYGYITGLPVGESQKVVDSWINGKPYVPSSWKDMAIQAIPMAFMTGIFGAIHAPEPTKIAPSDVAGVNEKEALITSKADGLHEVPTPPEKPAPINISAATPEELAKVGEAPITLETTAAKKEARPIKGIFDVAGIDQDEQELLAMRLQAILSKKGSVSISDIPSDITNKIGTGELYQIKSQLSEDPQHLIDRLNETPAPETPSPEKPAEAPVAEEKQVGPFYHFTESSLEDLSKFDLSKSQESSVLGKALYGFFDGGKWNPVGRKGKLLKGYISGDVIDLTQPITEENKSKIEKILGREIPNDGTIPLLSLEKKYGSIANALKEAGFVSAIHEGPGKSGKHIAIFEPEKVTAEESAQPEKPDATKTREEQKSNQPEYQNGDETRQATETSGGNRPVTGEEVKEEVTGAEEPGRKPVGISKAAVNEQRLNRMVESLPESERESNAEKINDALEINNKSRIPVESIVSDILENGNTARTPEEVALMTVEMNRLQLEREQLQKQFEQIKDPRPSDYAILNGEIDQIDKKINRLEKAVDKVGTSAGRLLQMFKIMLAEDYSPVALERKAVRDLRRPLTEDEKQTIAKQAEEHKALAEARDKAMASEQLKAENEAVKARYEEALKEIEALKAKAKKTPKEPSSKKAKSETPIDQKIVDKLNAMAEKVRQERKGKLYAKISPVDLGDVIIGASHIANGLKSFKDWSVKMVEELGDKVKPHLDRLWEAANAKIDSLQGGRTPEDVRARIKAEAVAGEELSHKSVDDLVKAHLEDGLRGEDEVMKAVHDDIKEAYPNATERDVRRAFSEYGKQVKVNPDELLKRKRELRTLVRLQESIDRLNEGLPALKTNSRREKVIQEIREKQSILNELLKGVKAPPTDEQLATAHSKKVTALKNAIEDLDKQLRTGERPPPKTRAEEPIDVEQLRSELDAMRRKRDEIDREEAPKFSPQEKENERLRKLYDKQIAELDARLKGAEKPKAEKTAFEQSKENEQKMAERDAMRQKLKEIEKEEADRKKPSPEQKEIDRLQKAIDDANDRIAKGEKTSPTPKKEPLTEYAKRLLEDLKKARQQFKRVTGKEPESREDRYNRRRMETIQKRIADMEDRMKRGDTSKPTRKEPPAKYPATEMAEARLKAKEREIDAWRQEKEKAERPIWEKALRGTSETARELTIAGINVLKKIGGYMPARALATSAEEVVGYTGKHLMGFGGVRGELESGASPLKTFPAQARGYLKGARQFLRTLKAGESESSLMYDKSHVEQRSSNWARWIGSNLHAALKNISATGKEEVYKEHLYANAIADGLIDPSNPFDPKNQMAIAALNLKAYVASKAEKLSEDNKIAEYIANWHKWLETPNKQGDLNPTAVVASHSIKALITKGIYKIGINYPTQTLKYAISKPLEAVGRTLNAYWKGLDSITPKEMDMISSAYKMGGVGAAMMLWGVLDAFNDEKDRVFGGYYQQGRKAGDAKWGTMRLFGTNWHIHMPAIEAAQFANTMTRAFIKNHKKFDVGMSGIQAFAEAMTGLISSAPIAGPITEISKSPSNWASYMIQGEVPSAVRDVAKMTDVNAKGETQHRYPRTIIENIEVGVPGLREKVRKYQWQK